MKPINEFITEMTRDEVIKIIRDNRPNTKNFRLTTRDGKSQNARLFVSQDGYPAYFSGRSRTRGYRLSDSQCDQLESVTPLGVHNEASERVKYSDEKDEIIAHLKEAVNSRKEYRYRWTKGYDNMVAVSHSSDYGLVGHYSEEYRGTGNGHYYILLDFEHALFGEDD